LLIFIDSINLQQVNSHISSSNQAITDVSSFSIPSVVDF